MSRDDLVFLREHLREQAATRKDFDMTKQTEPDADVLDQLDEAIASQVAWIIHDARVGGIPLWMARQRFLDAYDAAAEKADACQP